MTDYDLRIAKVVGDSALSPSQLGLPRPMLRTLIVQTHKGLLQHKQTQSQWHGLHASRSMERQSLLATQRKDHLAAAAAKLPHCSRVSQVSMGGSKEYREDLRDVVRKPEKARLERLRQEGRPTEPWLAPPQYQQKGGQRPFTSPMPDTVPFVLKRPSRAIRHRCPQPHTKHRRAASSTPEWEISRVSHTRPLTQGKPLGIGSRERFSKDFAISNKKPSGSSQDEQTEDDFAARPSILPWWRARCSALGSKAADLQGSLATLEVVSEHTTIAGKSLRYRGDPNASLVMCNLCRAVGPARWLEHHKVLCSGILAHRRVEMEALDREVA